MKTSFDRHFIYDWIAEGEHQMQDFKFEISDSRKIAKSLSAFANTDGGRLLIGVKDNGKISGVRSDEEIYMIQAAAEIYCRPAVEYTAETIEVEGRNVLIVTIPPSEERPVYALDESDRKWAYIRVADENILATPIHLLVWKQSCDLKGELVQYTEKEKLLLRLLNENTSLSLNRYCRLSKLSYREIQRLLARLIRYDIVEMAFENRRFLFRLK